MLLISSNCKNKAVQKQRGEIISEVMVRSEKSRENWSGRLGFILAAVGSAVGLGNLWKFPYVTWQNGGGLFVFIYLFCIILLGLPIMLSEIILGKISRQDTLGAFKKLDIAQSPFRFLGFLGIASSFVLLSYYSVIAGWSIEYQVKSYQNEFEKVELSRIYEILSKNSLKQQETKSKKRITIKPSNKPKGSINIEDIHQIIVHSHAEIATSVKKKAFLDALREPLPEKTYKKLQRDIPSLKYHHKLDFSEVESILANYTNSKTIKNHQVIAKWYHYFYNQKRGSPTYQEWLQKIFLPQHSSMSFDEFVNDHSKTILWHSVIMLIVCLIALGGIKNGIEKISRYGMSILLIIMLILMVNSLLLDKQNQALWFLIQGDPSKFKFSSFVEALGHAFFTLSIGLGVMITYGSYLKEKENAVSSATIITFMDTIISLLACLVIFPIVFAQGMQPTSGGIGILFTTLPLEFFKFPGGRYLSLLFYVLILAAALTSAISLLEVVVAYFQNQLKVKRSVAVFLAGVLIYLMGIPSAFSLGFLGNADKVVSNILLPMGGLMVAIFTGYRLDTQLIKNEFVKNAHSLKTFYLFKISIRYISPILLGFVLYNLIDQIL